MRPGAEPEGELMQRIAKVVGSLAAVMERGGTYGR